MPDRPYHVLEIPSMVDLSEFDPAFRTEVRHEWGVSDENFTIGWVGRLDRKKRVEDFIQAAALLHQTHPQARFVIIGGPDAFMPEYADELRLLARILGIQEAIQFLGDRKDVPRLLSGLDAFVWLSRGEGMPHVIAEAGAAGLPVIATRDNGAEEQITNNLTGLFVPYESPPDVAAALKRLMLDPELCQTLGRNLRQKVQREYSAEVVTRRWEALFDEVILEVQRGTRIEDGYQYQIPIKQLVGYGD
jgi:glycosyltransferase involved in cell wall biosynthesis